MEEPRELVEGRDTAPWPGLKRARALEHFGVLAARVAQWNAMRQFRAGLRISEDRTCLELLQLDGPQPPVAEWGLVFGDGIHNLRAALDCLVWEFAHLNGEHPQHPRRVGFPVLTAARQWREAAQRLASVPAELLERIRQVQPYQGNGDPELHALTVLSRLDNADKHQRVISAIASPENIQLDLEAMGVQMGGPVEGVGAFFETALDLSAVAPGEPFARLAFGLSIERDSRVEGTATIDVTPAVSVGTSLVPTPEVISMSVGIVDRLMNFLLTGQEPHPDHSDIAAEPEL